MSVIDTQCNIEVIGAPRRSSLAREPRILTVPRKILSLIILKYKVYV